jgi:hypothetical protein
MNPFDPEKVRQQQLGGVGFNWHLKRKLKKDKVDGALASWGHVFVGEAVKCCLVGFDHPATRLLTKAREWLIEAIRTKERSEPYVPDWDEAQRYIDFALTNWLLRSEHDEESVVGGVDHMKKDLKRKRNNEFPYQEFLDAEAYKEILAWPGGQPPKHDEETPMSFINFVDEGRFARGLAYVLSGGELPPKKMQKVAAAFLKRQAGYLLSHGHHTTFARWVKVLVWKPHRQALSARDSLLSCHEYLGVKPPTPDVK